MAKKNYKRTKPAWNKGKKLGKQPEWLVQKRVEARKGYTHSEETRRKMRVAQAGRKLNYIVWNKGLTRSKDNRIAQPWLGKKRPNMSGDKNHMWRGGQATLAERSRIHERNRNKDKRREQQRIRHNTRRKTDSKYRLDTNFSSAISMSLKGKKAWRKWNALVCYSLEELVNHLENRFDKDMTWENYGSYWHVDHIIPKCLFKYENAEEETFRKCWSLENLQPLRRLENLKKNRFITKT